jgi:hypothetical protein
MAKRPPKRNPGAAGAAGLATALMSMGMMPPGRTLQQPAAKRGPFGAAIDKERARVEAKRKGRGR